MADFANDIKLEIDDAVPILLLPVRLETQFELTGQKVTALNVRVFPDDIHIDSHEPALTQREQGDAQRYWTMHWRAGSDEQRRTLAWQLIAERHGVSRATWLKEQMRPVNNRPSLDDPLTAAERLPFEPQFPSVPLKEHDWSQAAVARLLPDRWIIIGYRNNELLFRVLGKPITSDLAVSPSPTTEREDDSDLLMDNGNRWTVELDAAIENGMAVRVEAQEAMVLEKGVDLLLALGVDSSRTPEQAVEGFVQMLTAHHYTEGLSFLKRGAPTNNTEHARSEWQDTDTPGVGSPASDTVGVDLPDHSNAGLWGLALGMTPTQVRHAFGGVAGSTDIVDTASRAMLAALWPATWGYIFTNLTDAADLKFFARVRALVLNHMRPGGHYSTIRIGNQPYGLIANADIDRIKPGSGRAPQVLHKLLLNLREKFWMPAINRSPHMGRRADPDEDLVDILGQQAVSSAFAIRPALGSAFMTNLRTFFGANSVLWWKNHQANAKKAFTSLGLTIETRISEFSYFKEATGRVPVLVQSDAEPGDELNPNYIEWLHTHTHQQILNETIPKPIPQTLLYRLLRQSALQNTVAKSKELIDQNVPNSTKPRIELELFDLSPDTLFQPAGTPTPVTPGVGSIAHPLTVTEFLESPIAGVTNGLSVTEFLDTKKTDNAKDFQEFSEFWTALGELSGMSVDDLELLLRETLDCSSHRLDAWLSALVDNELKSQRASANGKTGVHIGGYGWLENIKPRQHARSDGFVHVPSTRHAALAAVMRSGYLSHRAKDDAEAQAFSVNLTSARVRQAEWILDGIRQGHSLSVLLGYRFERALHEGHPDIELDRFIYSLRRLLPLVAGKLQELQAGESADTVAASNVVDGLALLRAWSSGRLSFSIANGLPVPGTNEHAAIVQELGVLQNLLDAVADSLITESFFHPDNPGRTAATLDSMASGELPPPELTFARTPSRGVGMIHKILLAFPASITEASPWPASPNSERARLDPVLNHWLGTIFGAPEQYRFRVRYLSDDQAALAESIVTLTSLALAPLDVMHFANAAHFGDDDELGRIAYEFARRERPVNAPLNVRIELLPIEDSVALVQLYQIALALRTMLARAKVLDARDFLAMGETGPSGIDLSDVQDRAGELIARFNAVHAELQALLASGDTSDVDAWISVFSRLQMFGVNNALHDRQGPEDVQRQALALLETMNARLVALATIDSRQSASVEEDEANMDNAAIAQANLAFARERAQVVLGTEVCLLPHFNLANSDVVRQSFAVQSQQLNGDESALLTWFQQMARVRGRVATFNEVLLYGSAVRQDDAYELKVVQLPFDETALWAGLPQASERQPVANLTSLCVFDPFQLDPERSLLGIVLDEWPESIPLETHTTSMAFHYDQPSSRAPNSLLLAVAPHSSATWNVEQLEKTITDTLNLSKIRCVDSDSLQGLGQFLPALFFASNSEKDTVSAQFEALFQKAVLDDRG